LNRLTADGFLTFSRQQGFFRKPLTIKTIADLYEMCELLGRGVARLATERASDAALDLLDADSAAAQASAKTIEEILAAHERFHEQLAALTGNAELIEALKNLNERIRFIRWVDLEAHPQTPWAGHAAILSAIRQRDAARVEALICEQVGLSHDRLASVVKDAYAQIYMNRESTLIPPV
jgi:DNA-binding GntR family transcriptional regulator